MRYLIVIEKANGNFSGFAPDLPGCIATGTTPEETRHNMEIAVSMHVKGLIEDGLPVPQPNTRADYVDILVAGSQ